MYRGKLRTLLCVILGEDQIANFGKKSLKVHLIFIREWPRNNLSIFRNFDNSPLVHFIRDLPLELDLTE